MFTRAFLQWGRTELKNRVRGGIGAQRKSVNGIKTNCGGLDWAPTGTRTATVMPHLNHNRIK
jgi:hypothetical protein